MSYGIAVYDTDGNRVLVNHEPRNILGIFHITHAMLNSGSGSFTVTRLHSGQLSWQVNGVLLSGDQMSDDQQLPLLCVRVSITGNTLSWTASTTRNTTGAYFVSPDAGNALSILALVER